MKEITAFAQKVLNFLEPDPMEQKNILALADESAPSQADEMKKFKDRIIQARQKNEKVMVAGDYDCDGVISTSIMVDALRTLGIETGFYIPDRLHEGYGLRPKIVELAAAKGYSLLITVDNGVAANEALKKQKKSDLRSLLQTIINLMKKIRRNALCLSILQTRRTLSETVVPVWSMRFSILWAR